MDDLPRRKLREIIDCHGTSLCREPARCRALLNDYCPGHRREVFLLLSVLEEQAVAELLRPPGGVPWAVLVERLTRRLGDSRAINEDAARWAVESWALALGVIPHPLPPPRVPAPPPTRPAPPPRDTQPPPTRSPPPRPPTSPVDDPLARSVRASAIALGATAVVAGLVNGLLVCGGITSEAGHGFADPAGIAMILYFAGSTIACGWIFLASRSMARTQQYRRAVLASGLLMLVSGACCLPAIPVAAWSLFVLLQRPVRSSFEGGGRPDPDPPSWVTG